MLEDLPIKRDFDPHGCGMDEHWAWRNFGGLTLKDACEKFETAPEIYQEDFMFMGTKAFVFYFPVIDRFLRKMVALNKTGQVDCQSWILPQCINTQFQCPRSKQLVLLKPSVLSLCEFMLDNIDKFKDDWNKPEEIELNWRNLQLRAERY